MVKLKHRVFMLYENNSIKPFLSISSKIYEQVFVSNSTEILKQTFEESRSEMYTTRSVHDVMMLTRQVQYSRESYTTRSVHDVTMLTSGDWSSTVESPDQWRLVQYSRESYSTLTLPSFSTRDSSKTVVSSLATGHTSVCGWSVICVEPKEKWPQDFLAILKRTLQNY